MVSPMKPLQTRGFQAPAASRVYVNLQGWGGEIGNMIHGFNSILIEKKSINTDLDID